MASSPAETASYHIMSIESILGLPFRAFAELVIGFLIFGIALQHTGGGKFFIDLALAMFGHVRGGSAKVAIVSSGLMGSMSGSVITNVLTTGQMTIPAMQKNGFEKEYAAGVEACASTGGVLLPPIMGSTAFVMATFLNVSYTNVALAAAVPAFLYFFGLFIQVDAYAARKGLKGTPKNILPSMRKTLQQGWFYIAAFITLIFLLIFLQREAIAPFIATGMLLFLNQVSAKHRWDLSKAGSFLVATGKLLMELLTIMAGVGLIVGALSVTGLSGTLVNDLALFSGGFGSSPPTHGSIHKFYSRNWNDGNSRVCLPRNSPCTCTYSGRTGSHERSSLYSILGHAVVHHAARRFGGVRSCEHCRVVSTGYRLQSNEAWQHNLFYSIFLCARTCPYNVRRFRKNSLRDRKGCYRHNFYCRVSPTLCFRHWFFR
jgi:hypothetical protein